MAPPTKLEPALMARLIGLVRAGNYIDTAAASCGVDVRNVRRWLARGSRALDKLEEGEQPAPEDEPFVVFVQEFRSAEADAEARCVLRLHSAGEKDWKADLAYLERRFPKRWGMRLNVMLDDELNALWDRLEGKLDATDFDRVVRAANGEDCRTTPRDD